MENIEKNLALVHQQIEQAAIDHNRCASDIVLLAVSKKKPVEDIREAFRCGQKNFGENYLQEAQSKISELADLDIVWHFIGPIQSNKTKALASSFEWVHCVDRLKIAQRLNDHRPGSMPPLNICIQVNADLEPSKSGIAPSEIIALAEAIAHLPRLRLRGLMSFTFSLCLPNTWNYKFCMFIIIKLVKVKPDSLKGIHKLYYIPAG